MMGVLSYMTGPALAWANMVKEKALVYYAMCLHFDQQTIRQIRLPL